MLALTRARHGLGSSFENTARPVPNINAHGACCGIGPVCRYAHGLGVDIRPRDVGKRCTVSKHASGHRTVSTLRHAWPKGRHDGAGEWCLGLAKRSSPTAGANSASILVSDAPPMWTAPVLGSPHTRPRAILLKAWNLLGCRQGWAAGGALSPSAQDLKRNASSSALKNSPSSPCRSRCLPSNGSLSTMANAASRAKPTSSRSRRSDANFKSLRPF